MGKIYNSIKDFENLSVKVTLNNKKYNSIIKVIDDKVYLSIDVSRDVALWENFDTNFDQINGRTIYNNVPISFISCFYSEKYMNKSTEGENLLFLDFRVAYIAIGMQIRSYKNKMFDRAEVKFENIDNFTDELPYTYDYLEKKYKSNATQYYVNCNDYKININFGFDNQNSRKGLSLKRNTLVIFDLNKKYSYEELLNEIFKLNYFFMLILRRHVIISSISFFHTKNRCKIFFCYKNEVYEDKFDKSEVLNITRIKIEELSDINSIYIKYLDYFNKLYPVLEIYYSTVCGFISDLNRFIVGTTTLEYFSNEFDRKGALYYFNLETNKKGKEPYYANKIHSLLKKANSVFKFSEQEVLELSKIINDARVYYIHYNKKKKSLTDYEKFYFSQFLFDILIVNIGLLLGIDIGLLKHLTNYGKYYKKENILSELRT